MGATYSVHYIDGLTLVTLWNRKAMQHRKLRLVLVTGAPRSGTTPIGATLALAPGTRMIYEPMGPTGDVRIPTRFAVPGQPQFPMEAFHAFLCDLQALKLSLGPQWRQSYVKMPLGQYLARRVFGSRTRMSYLLARLDPALRTVLWKDPMASLAIPSVLNCGVPTVVCIRSPLAHAASYKRRGWSVDIVPIYANFRDCYGPVDAVETRLACDRELTKTERSALLWHLVYLLALRVLRGCYGAPPAPLLVATGSQLEADEFGFYKRIYETLGLAFEGKARRRLEVRSRRTTVATPEPTRVHEWNRAIAVLNSDWREVLDQGEVAMIEDMNSRVYDSIEALSGKVTYMH